MDKLIASGTKVDMVLTDPPYGTTQCKWDTIIPFEQLWARIWRVIKTNGAVCLFGSEPFSSILRCSNLKDFKYDWVWIKNKATGHLNSKKQPLRKNELISVFYSSQPIYNPQGLKTKEIPTVSKGNRGKKGSGSSGECYGYAGKDAIQEYENYPTNVVNFQVDMKAEYHPTQKPVDLYAWILKNYSKEGNKILDTHLGSGSSRIAAYKLGFDFVGCEIDKEYFDKSVERFNRECLGEYKEINGNIVKQLNIFDNVSKEKH